MKRLTIKAIQKFINLLKYTEYIGGIAEQEKQTAITVLEIMLDDMEYRGIKSLKVKEGEES